MRTKTLIQTQRQKEHPTQSDYNFIITRIHVKEWIPDEDEACKQWFGVRYLGLGQVLCGFCLSTAVDFKGYLADHVCEDCRQSLDQLDQQ